MRRLTTILCAASMTAGLAACAHKDQGQKAPQMTPEQQAAQSQNQAAQSAQTALQNFQKSQQAYIQKSEQDLNQLDAKVAAFRAQAPTNPADKNAHDAAVNALEDNMNKSRQSLNTLKTANADSWEQDQRQFEQSLLTTRAAYDAASARMAH